MKSLRFSRYALGVCVAPAMLVACGPPQVPIGTPGVLPQPVAIATSAARGTWMLPEAKHEALLYVSSGDSTIYVYRYNKGNRLVGTIAPYGRVLGICADGSGNVWVPIKLGSSSGQVLEYPHGGTQPIATLNNAGSYPDACAVDPTTGNLAVTNLCGYFAATCGPPGNVVVYRHAQGRPKLYQKFLYYYEFCAYDDSGNLFILGEGLHRSFGLLQQHRGHRRLIIMKLNRRLRSPGGVQWDGTSLALGSNLNDALYRFVIDGRHGKVISTGPLTGTTGIGQFFIHGTQVIVPSERTNTVGFYEYPNGGSPKKTLSVFAPYGVTVSFAPH